MLGQIPPLFLGAAPFVPFSQVITTTGAQSVPVPAGATKVKSESIAGGQSGSKNGSNYTGGAGGLYARTNATSLAGVPALYITVGAVGADSSVRLNDGAGTVINLSKTGIAGATAPASTGVGDVFNLGGSGGNGAGSNSTGGGAGGPSGAGGAGSNGGTSTPGTSAGAPAGIGGDRVTGNGANYGGGGAVIGGANYPGAQGWVQLSWS